MALTHTNEADQAQIMLDQSLCRPTLLGSEPVIDWMFVASKFINQRRDCWTYVWLYQPTSSMLLPGSQKGVGPGTYDEGSKAQYVEVLKKKSPHCKRLTNQSHLLPIFIKMLFCHFYLLNIICKFSSTAPTLSRTLWKGCDRMGLLKIPPHQLLPLSIFLETTVSGVGRAVRDAAQCSNRIIQEMRR